jgi:3-hydroxyisobutyrate dehydrogenase
VSTPESSATTIAFIGLGNMGGPMAANLVKAGYNVQGVDLNVAAVEAATEAGITIAPSVQEAVSGADVIITMLPSGDLVLRVYGGPDGVLASARDGALLIDCSTIAVDEARAAARLAEKSGLRFMDAPVSGGVGGAEAGTLTLMVGGTADAFADGQTYLEPMAGRIVHCGEAGAGQAAKICNNMILGISMIAVSEAFVLGERLGLSHQALFDVASVSSGQCWALTSYCPVPDLVPASPANREYKPGFATGLMAKDLGLAMKAADSTDTHTRLGATASAIYADYAQGSGHGLDFSSIVNDIRLHPQPPTGADRG